MPSRLPGRAPDLLADRRSAASSPGRYAGGRAAPIRSLGAGLAACLLCSCTVGPNFHRPVPPQVGRYLPQSLPPQTASVSGPDGAAQRFLAGTDVAPQWWRAFGSPELDALISDALAANPSVAAAKATLRQALETAAAQRGSYWPQVQANFGASRQENATGVLSPTLGSGVPIFNLYTPQLTVSFAPDLLGGNRRQVESLAAAADAARFELDATYLTLVDNIIVTAVQVADLTEQLHQTERIASLERKSLEVLRHSLALGAVAGADVAAQETAVAQVEESVPPLRHALEVQRHQLAVLTGRLPSDPPAAPADLDALHLPTEIPLSLPSRLVEHRPDVRAAESLLHAATAQVGVSIADMLPQFTITGGVGSVATLMSGLFQGGTGFWSAGGSLTQTLFAGGSLVHHKRAAEAALDAAGATYRATVLAAFQNVADALHALMTDADTLAAATRAAAAAQNSYDIARAQLDLGSVNALTLLSAEQSYLQADIALVQARASRLADTAALFQALGGPPQTGVGGR